jgi:hypothetical protein
MGRIAHSMFAGLLGITMMAGCDKSSNEGVPLTAAPSESAAMPAGHPPMGGAAKKAGQVIEGTVVETMDVKGYTYLNLDSASGKVWAAVPRAAVKVGDKVAVEQAMPMKNFESPTLKRKFDLIYFGTLRGAGAGSPHAAAATGSAMPAGSALPIPDDIKVEKAKGKGAHTVAEIYAGAKELSGKEVSIRGVVVKVNKRIMGKNWVHLRDGSGSEAKKDNDIVITSEEVPQVGATVLMVGKVATDKDFGSGYSYGVLVEDAKFTTEGGK